MSASTTVTVKINKKNKTKQNKTKRLTAWNKSGRNLIYRWRRRGFWRRFWAWRGRRLWTKRRKKIARRKVSSSTSAMLFVAIFPPAHRACNFDTYTDQNVCNSWLCNRLRLSAIIWKRLRPAICDPRSSAIVCDHMETSLNYTVKKKMLWKCVFRFPKLFAIWMVMHEQMYFYQDLTNKRYKKWWVFLWRRASIGRSHDLMLNTFLAFDPSTSFGSLFTATSFDAFWSGGTCHAYFSRRETVRLYRCLDNW